MNFFKKMMPLALALALVASSVYAQGKVDSKDISDQELKTFVATAGDVQQVQREAQMKMQQIIQDEGMKPQRFQMIMMSKRNPKMADSLNITDEEQQAFQNIKPKMASVNKNMMQKFQSVFQEHDITQQRFRTIAQAMQSNQELQQRFQKMQAKQMQSDSAGGDNS